MQQKRIIDMTSSSGSKVVRIPARPMGQRKRNPLKTGGSFDFPAAKKEEKKIAKGTKRVGFAFLAILLLAGGGYFIFGAKPEKMPNFDTGMQDLSAGKFNEAAARFEKALDSGEGDEAETLYRLAVTQYNQKQYDKAIATYEKVIAADRNNAAAYNGLANIYRDQKNNSKAEEYYKKATSIDPLFAKGYVNWAIMLIDAGNKEDAKKVLDEGTKNMPDNGEIKNLQEMLK